MARRRIRLERGLYQDGAIFYACATPPGSRSAVWKSLGTVGKMEARRLRDEFAAEVSRGQLRESSQKRRRVTLMEVGDLWVDAQRALVAVGELSPRTLQGYELSVRRHLAPWFGNQPIRSISADDLVAWHADQRRSGAATWSIKGRWTALRGVLGHAVRHGMIDLNPADALTSRERPKPGPSSQRFLTEDEMRSLLDVSTGRYHVLIAILLFGGLRISEALGLVWGEVDFVTGHLRVRNQLARDGQRVRLKTPRSRRDVVVMQTLVAVLRRHRLASHRSRPADPLFATSSGSAMSARNAGRAFGRMAEKARIAGATPHALRHTYASLLIAQGRDPVYVSDQLGHANPAITMRIYAHLFRAAQQERDARDGLEAAYGRFLRPPR